MGHGSLFCKVKMDRGILNCRDKWEKFEVFYRRCRGKQNGLLEIVEETGTEKYKL